MRLERGQARAPPATLWGPALAVLLVALSASPRPLAEAQRRPAGDSVSISADSQRLPGAASSTALAAASAGEPELSGAPPEADTDLAGGRLPVRRPTRRPTRRPVAATASASLPEMGPEEAGAEEPPRRARRPTARPRPPKRRQEFEPEMDDDELDCEHDDDDDDAYDYAMRPMRQLGRMMGSMFEHMQDMASGDFGALPRGANVASASTYSDHNGDSRSSTLVRSGGRTRGIITERRNGRTTTRRIGDASNSDDNQEE